MDIKKIVNEKVEEVIKNGEIEELIQNKVKESLSKAIEEFFRSYGDFQKDLEKTLGEKMKVNLEEMEIPDYNKLILQYIEKEIDNTMAEQGIEKIKENLNDLLKSAPKEIELQDIVNKYIENNDEELREDYIGVIYYDYEFSSIEGYVDIKLNIDKPDSFDKPDLRFTLKEIEENKYEIFRIDFDGLEIKDDFTLVGRLYGIEKFMFKLWAAGTVIIGDPEGFDYIDPSTEYGY
jgi:hypothetical protein